MFRFILRTLHMLESKLDLEFSRYLPLLNSRQKRVVLTLVKAYAAKQSNLWEKLYDEQQLAIKKTKARKKGSY